MAEEFDAIVLGAGAAGLMCVYRKPASAGAASVLECAESRRQENPYLRRRPLQLYQPCIAVRKISSPPIHISASRRWPATRLPISSRWSRSMAFRYHEKHKGQLFCDGSAREIVVDASRKSARRAGVRIVVSTTIRDVRRGDVFAIVAGDREYRAPALVVATGGLSIPKIGATSFGY